MPKILQSFLLAALSFISLEGLAIQSKSHYDDPGFHHGRDYFGNDVESIDPFSGNLIRRYVDIHLPGNAGFDFKVQRTYNRLNVGQFASPFGAGWDIHFGRVKKIAGAGCASHTAQLLLELPDGSQHRLYGSASVPGTQNAGSFVSQGLWYAQCINDNSINVHSPDGTVYEMSEADGIYLHAKIIRDRFGNQMIVNYRPPVIGFRKVVDLVHFGSQTITFQYSGNNLLERIYGPQGQWAYDVQALSGRTELRTVTLPVGGAWSYTYHDASILHALSGATNPFGGVVSYTYETVYFWQILNTLQQTVAVKTKIQEGKTWTFTYQPGCASGVARDVTTVTRPDGLGTIRYEHDGYCSVGSGNVWKIGLEFPRYFGHFR